MNHRSAVSVVLFLCLFTSAQAAVRISGNPTDYIQLTNAVAHANNGDTILVSTGTYEEVVDLSGITLTISGGYNHDCSAKVIGAKSCISGAGFLGGRGSVFDITSSILMLRDLQITDGSAALGDPSLSGGGLAIYNSSVVTAQSCQVFNNSSKGYGGGIYVQESSLTLQDTVVCSNIARGASFPASAGMGGGIAAVDSTLLLNGASPVFTNEAFGLGGGIYALGGTTLINHASVHITDNIASNGGGLYINGGFLALNNGADIGGNTANTLGGGVALVNGARGVFQTFGTSVGMNDGQTGMNQVTNGSGGGIAAIESYVVISNWVAVAHNTASSCGGAIYLLNSRLTANNAYIGADRCTNRASSSGGGIAAFSSTVDVFNTAYIFNNNAGSGGGIYASNSAVNIPVNCRIGWTSSEYANQAMIGGGLCAQDSRLVMNGSILNNVVVFGGGGGMYLLDCSLDSTGAVIQGNVAMSIPGYCGGGVALAGNTDAHLINAQIISNQCTFGGGIGSMSTGLLQITGCIISNNTAAESGGGIYCGTNVWVYLEQSMVTDNQAETNGGGAFFHNDGTLISIDSSFLRNHAGLQGGAVALEQGEFYNNAHNSNTYMTYNSAYEGGAMAADQDSILTLDAESNIFITVNEALGNGGGLWIANGSEARIFGTAHFGINSAEQGAGLFVGPDSRIQIQDNESGCPSFYYNIASDYGGGICVNGAQAEASLLNTRIGCGYMNLGNWCTSSDSIHGGGGVAVLNEGYISMTNCWIKNNTAYGRGGGVLVYHGRMQIGGAPSLQPFSSDLPPSIMENNATTNASTGNGGAIAGSYSTVRAYDVLIQSNTAVRGGAIHLDNYSTGLVINTVMAKNTASIAGDGIRISGSSVATLLHCTIVSNDNGEGVSVGTGASALTNCIVRGHSTSVSAGQQVTRSDIQGGYAGTGNIDIEPHFFNPMGSDYRLKYASPCITSGVTLADVPTDAIGMARPQGLRSDMGAFEYNGNIYDSDLDSMTDFWEVNYTLNPLNNADAAIDMDDDSYLNREEFIADTDPTLGDRYFHILDISRAGTQAVVSFMSSDSCEYKMEQRTAPDNLGPWTLVTNDVPGTGGMISLTNIEPAGVSCVYRLGVWRP
jgi:fibronectin-binding autotransporter adhesin